MTFIDMTEEVLNTEITQFDYNHIINIINTESDIMKGLDKALASLNLLNIDYHTEMVSVYRFCQDYYYKSKIVEILEHDLVQLAEKEYIQEMNNALRNSPICKEVTEELDILLASINKISKNRILCGHLAFKDWEVFTAFSEDYEEQYKALFIDAFLQNECSVMFNIFDCKADSCSYLIFGLNHVFAPNKHQLQRYAKRHAENNRYFVIPNINGRIDDSIMIF